MNDIVLTKLDTDEILRYMGCPPEQADEATRRLAEDCGQALLSLFFGYYILIGKGGLAFFICVCKELACPLEPWQWLWSALEVSYLEDGGSQCWKVLEDALF